MKVPTLLGGLSVAALVWSAPVDPQQKVLGDDDDNDDRTPLPLVIWHGLGDK